MSLILILPTPFTQDCHALRESMHQLIRLRTRLRALADLKGCDTAALHRHIEEVEEAIIRTECAYRKQTCSLGSFPQPGPLPLRWGEGGGASPHEQPLAAPA